MKKILILLAIVVCFGINAKAQSNSGLLDFKENRIGISTGINYAILPISLSYERGINLFNYKHPISVGIELTTPLFNLDLNDLKIKLKAQSTLIRIKNFETRVGVSLVQVNTKMKRQSMKSIGTDIYMFVGFINSKWSIGAEATYNQMFASEITHTDDYKELIYSEVKDGWYDNTASNLQVGLHINRRIRQFDAFLGGGLSTTAKFNSLLFVPSVYINMGVAYRF